MKKIYIDIRLRKIFLALATALIVMQCINSSAGEYKTITTLTTDKAIGSQVTWQITAQQEDAGEKAANLHAKICFSDKSKAEQQCETAEGFTVSNIEVLPFADKTKSSGILFLANTSGLGGGPDFMSLWVYDKNTQKFKNILPAKLAVKALGVYQFFPSLDNKCILVIADPETLLEPDEKVDDPDYAGIWSPHRYIFSIYKYSEDKGFVQAGSFTTKQKHNPEDENLIDSEMKNVKNLLK